MPAIDKTGLTKAMDKSGVTKKQLADTLDLSLQYVCDITVGRRTLKRNPELRRRIADALDVPVHWIEAQEARA
jgi:hypothetical protein